MDTNNDGLLYDARGDVALIMGILQKDSCYGSISLHAQQAAEKMVKHVFELNGVKHKKIHDIDLLLQRASKFGWLSDVSRDELENAKHLSKYAVLGMYSCGSITREDAFKTIEWCNQIADIVERNGYPVVRINV